MTQEAIKASVDALTTTTTDALGTMRTDIGRIAAETDRISAVLKRPGFVAANDNGDIKTEHTALNVFARSGDGTGLADARASMSVGSIPAADTASTRRYPPA